MFCESCGSFIPDGQSFCSNCGTPAPKPAAQPASAPAPAAPFAAAPVAASAPAPAPAPAPASAPVVQPIAAQPISAQPQPFAQPVAQQYPMAPQIPSTQPQHIPSVYQPVVQPMNQQPVYSQPSIVVQQPVITQPQAPRGNGAATAGLTFGILTVVFCWASYFCYIFGLLGLIFSIVGLCKKKAPGKGKAIAGLILTVIGSILAAVIIELFWASVGMLWNAALEEVYDELESDIYSTSYSDTNTGINSEDFYINGDFVTTDNGYASGTLYIGGYLIQY